MKAVVLCEGTTDLLMIQFILQYKYGWRYDGFVENTVTNRLVKRKLVKNESSIEIVSCGGMMEIPKKMKEYQEQMEYATRQEEMIQQMIVMFDHDTVDSNNTFIKKINEELGTCFTETCINSSVNLPIENVIYGEVNISIYLRCLPETETGAIENVMLDALSTDETEEDLINRSKTFILEVSQCQNRYLQKVSRINKAIFNTYFAIRTPEEKYDERARILRAYNWNENERLNNAFSFLNI